MGDMTRRDLGKLLLVLPAAGLSARVLGADAPSEEAQFIAKSEAGLSDDERGRLLKGLGDQEKSLKTVRDFPVSNDVSPAFLFRPRPSRRS